MSLNSFRLLSRVASRTVREVRAMSVLGSKVGTLFDHIPKQMVNLAMGSPREEFLQRCTDVLKTATEHRMAEPDAYKLFQYGPEIGYLQFRTALAEMLTEEYQAPVDVNDIIATAGATQALFIMSQLLFSPGDPVFVEDPTYFLANKMFELDLGLSLRGVPMDDNGIVPEELEKVLEENKDYKPRQLTERKPYWGILYVLSTFQNPRGMCLSPDRCKRVIQLARKYNLLVISDDVYNLLYHGDKPPTRLFSFDNKSDPDYSGNAVSNGSFSKIFGPGMRLGWLEAPQKVREIILSSAMATSGGGFNHTASGIMTSVISLGLLRKMITEFRPKYKEQCNILCSTLKAQVPSVEIIEPSGGFFVWVKLPGNINGSELLTLCKEKYDIIFCPGELTSVGENFKNCIRLGFCHYDSKTLEMAATKLAEAIKSKL